MNNLNEAYVLGKPNSASADATSNTVARRLPIMVQPQLRTWAEPLHRLHIRSVRNPFTQWPERCAQVMPTGSIAVHTNVNYRIGGIMAATVHPDYERYAARILALPEAQVVEPSPAVVTAIDPPTSILQKQDGVHYDKLSQRRSISAALANYVTFGPAADVLWPGALVRSSSLSSGMPALINVARSPVDVFLNFTGVASTGRSGVTPSAFGVNSAINEVVAANPGATAGGAVFEYCRIHTARQAMLQLGLAAEWVGGSATASLSSREDLENNLVLASFMQVYFTATFSPPIDGNKRIFAPGISDPELAHVLNPTDPPCYVSSVSFGRRMLFRLESRSSFSEIRAALRVTQDFLAGSVDANAAGQALETLSSTEFQIIAMGGSMAGTVEAISSQDFLAYIRSGLEPGPMSAALPIGYTVRSLRDNQIVTMRRAEEFDASTFHRKKRTIRVRLDRLKVHNDGDSGFEGQGDFTWRFHVNGEILHAQTSERTIGTGATVGIGATWTKELAVTDSTEVILSGRIVEIDDGASGANDELPELRAAYLLYSLGSSTPGRMRLGAGSDPDVEVYWRIDVVGESSVNSTDATDL